MNYTYLYWMGLFGINLWLTIMYLAYLFVGNESILKSSIVAIAFILFAYATLDCDMEVEKARMRGDRHDT